ncbi:hypothetical protein FO488_15960 [Geobacter sp. FeAm09]|uniref:hypothetical protein n=1 Tax=Geobacter sp. FeAm09 TaxID=2597769 RepID=UPI0011EDEAED|nr:hypothetical protein [Geobacter sp. FeAm09]QEM69503.1 hypothetical protein FO488_15960 [Geobacter sp. FeAm09]
MAAKRSFLQNIWHHFKHAVDVMNHIRTTGHLPSSNWRSPAELEREAEDRAAKGGHNQPGGFPAGKVEAKSQAVHKPGLLERLGAALSQPFNPYRTVSDVPAATRQSFKAMKALTDEAIIRRLEEARQAAEKVLQPAPSLSEASQRLAEARQAAEIVLQADRFPFSEKFLPPEKFIDLKHLHEQEAPAEKIDALIQPYRDEWEKQPKAFSQDRAHIFWENTATEKGVDGAEHLFGGIEQYERSGALYDPVQFEKMYGDKINEAAAAFHYDKNRETHEAQIAEGYAADLTQRTERAQAASQQIAAEKQAVEIELQAERFPFSEKFLPPAKFIDLKHLREQDAPAEKIDALIQPYRDEWAKEPKAFSQDRAHIFWENTATEKGVDGAEHLFGGIEQYERSGALYDPVQYQKMHGAEIDGATQTFHENKAKAHEAQLADEYMADLRQRAEHGVAAGMERQEAISQQLAAEKTQANERGAADTLEREV